MHIKYWYKFNTFEIKPKLNMLNKIIHNNFMLPRQLMTIYIAVTVNFTHINHVNYNLIKPSIKTLIKIQQLQAKIILVMRYKDSNGSEECGCLLTYGRALNVIGHSIFKLHALENMG